MKFHTKKQIIWIMWTTIILAIGLILFKYIPMYIYGKDILFDASSHMAWTSWGLYVLWFFVDQKESWRIPYFALCAVILIIMGIQRVVAGAHNEVGVMLGLAVAGLAIIIPRWKEFRKGVRF
jgi:membrane-associated phospholipid phosphatase